MPGNRPDFNIGVKDPATGQTNSHVGAAWKNDDGSIGIKLNAGVSLTSDLQIRLFPPTEKKTLKKPDLFQQAQEIGGRKPTNSALFSAPRRHGGGFDDIDDDIPF